MKKLLAKLGLVKESKVELNEDAFAKFNQHSNYFGDKIVETQALVQEIIDGINELTKLKEQDINTYDEILERLDKLESKAKYTPMYGTSIGLVGENK